MDSFTVKVQNYREHLGVWGKLKDEVPFEVTYIAIRCKFCGSKDIIRYGHYKYEQYWWCKQCQRKFINNKALPRMRFPLEEINTAVRMFFEGVPMKVIRRFMREGYNNCPSDSTIYYWIQRFIRDTFDKAKNHHPEVGDIWLVHNTNLEIGMKNYWILDLIDTRTYYLITTVLSPDHDRNYINRLMDKAKDRTNKMPKKVLVDRHIKYLDKIESSFNVDVEHIQMKSLAGQEHKELVQNWHDAVNERTLIMRVVRREKTAEVILDGWFVYYNYYRPFRSHYSKTPAKRAGISSLP